MTNKPKLKATIFDFHGRVMAVVNNSYIKTHILELSNKCNKSYNKTFLHEEVLAITRAMKIGDPYKIKIERYYKDGNPAMAAPCKCSLLAIKEAGITVVEHTVG
jgi:hypothetical protein